MPESFFVEVHLFINGPFSSEQLKLNCLRLKCEIFETRMCGIIELMLRKSFLGLTEGMADCKMNGRVVKVAVFVGRFGFIRGLGVLQIEVMDLELALGRIFLHFLLSKAFICLFAERFL
jgi:hypothetical protein